MKKRIVVIGANAAGAKAASKAKRQCPSAEIVVLDRNEIISYGACGLPYYVSGEVENADELMKTSAGITRDHSFFSKIKGITVYTQEEVFSINRKQKIVKSKNLCTEIISEFPYDSLVLALGSSPIRLNLPGENLANVFTIKTIDDAKLLRNVTVAGQKACVIGGGLIGLETAEALQRNGMDVTILELKKTILSGVVDSELSEILVSEIISKGVTVRTLCFATELLGDEFVTGVRLSTGEEIPASIVILSPGVVPNTHLANECGLELGVSGAITVSEFLQTSDPNIYACGDCCESTHLLTKKQVFVPLGSTANKQGRIAGINAAGGKDSFPGVLGTSIARVFDFGVGKTGLTELEAFQNGYETESIIVPSHDRAHFFPSAKPVILKLLAEKVTRRLLGLQAVGPGDISKRIDAAATAITFGATVDQISTLDLAYAPPFASVMDSLIVAADALRNKLDGRARCASINYLKKRLDSGEEIFLLDVRSQSEYDTQPRIFGAKLIPLDELKDRIKEIPTGSEIITFCKVSLRGYEAQLILTAAGFENVKFLEGGIFAWPYKGQN